MRLLDEVQFRQLTILGQISAYSQDEPRDDHGRWASDAERLGGSGSWFTADGRNIPVPVYTTHAVVAKNNGLTTMPIRRGGDSSAAVRDALKRGHVRIAWEGRHQVYIQLDRENRSSVRSTIKLLEHAPANVRVGLLLRYAGHEPEFENGEKAIDYLQSINAYSDDEPRDEKGEWTDSDNPAPLASRLEQEGDPAVKARLRDEYNTLVDSSLPAKLTTNEQAAVQYYLYQGNEAMNGYLRATNRVTDYIGQCGKCPDLDSAIDKATLPKDIQLYRGAALRDNVIAQLKPGAVIEDQGFVSTSLNTRTAYQFSVKAGGDSVMFAIDVPKGSHGLPASVYSKPDVDYSGEREVLLPRGAQFKVESAMQKVDRDGFKVNVVHVKYIGSKPKSLPVQAQGITAEKKKKNMKFVWLPGDFKIIPPKKKIAAYSEDEPRDERGRWSSEDAYQQTRDDYSAKSREALHTMATGLPSLGTYGVDFDKMTPAQLEAYYTASDRVRHDQKDWDHSTRVAMSEGKLSIKDALSRGFTTSGHDSDNEGRTAPDGSKWGWQKLPLDLYHVTTAKDAVLDNGLKSRAELGQDRGKGLGGGEDASISFATSREGAENLYHTMLEARDVASGKVGADKLVEAAKTGRSASKPFLTDWMQYYDQKWQPGKPLPMEVQNAVDGRELKDAGLGTKITDLPANAKPTGYQWMGGDNIMRVGQYTIPASEAIAQDHRFDLYKTFLAYREMAGGSENPLFFMTDVPGLAKTPKDQIAIIRATPVKGAMGYPMGALTEWRTHSGKAVNVQEALQPEQEIRAQRKMRAVGPSDEERDSSGKWTDSGGTPVHHISYSAFKLVSGERFFAWDFARAASGLRRARSNAPKLQHWIAFSLGSSWHDPQAMGRLVSGKEPPKGVLSIRTALDLRKALSYMTEAEARAHGLSRKGN